MASSETSRPSIRQGVRLVPPDSSVSVEEVLLAVGEQVGHDQLSFASRMNKAVVVFVTSEARVHTLVESGVFIRDSFVQVSPLSVPSTRITVSGVPPFIPNELLEKELRRFGKFASGFKAVSLGCKDPKLKHVLSLRRQVFMFLESQSQTLEVSFKVKHGDGLYIVYASSGQIKCFECGDAGHKRAACPRRQQRSAEALAADAGIAAACAVDAALLAARSTDVAGPVGGPAAVLVAGPVDVVFPVGGDAALLVAGPVDVAGPADVAGPVGGPAAVLVAGAGPVAGAGLVGGAGLVAGAGPVDVAGPVGGVVGGAVSCAVSTDNDNEDQGQSNTQEASVVQNLTASGPRVAPQSGCEEAAAGSTGGDHSRALEEGQGAGAVSNSQLSAEGEDMEYGSGSETASTVDTCIKGTDVYSLDEIKAFLDVTFNKSVQLSSYFGDTEKFIRSVGVVQREVGFDLLDERKRFRLKRHISILRKAKRDKKAKTTE